MCNEIAGFILSGQSVHKNPSAVLFQRCNGGDILSFIMPIGFAA